MHSKFVPTEEYLIDTWRQISQLYNLQGRHSSKIHHIWMIQSTQWSIWPNSKDLHSKAKGEIPINFHSRMRLTVRSTVYLDADHIYGLMTTRVISSFTMTLKETPVRWISKQQIAVKNVYFLTWIAFELVIHVIHSLEMTLNELNLKLEIICQ